LFQRTGMKGQGVAQAYELTRKARRQITNLPNVVTISPFEKVCKQ